MRNWLVPLVVLLFVMPAAAQASPLATASAVCSDYGTQAEAQEAADTIDADGDGIFCESLPCPCAGPSDNGTKEPRVPACTLTKATVSVGISKTRYPAVLAHIRDAVKAGWPKVLKLNRRGAEKRRARALRGWPTRRGFDRDEWPMAFARSTWKTHIAYVPSSQNRGAGASISLKLRRYCDGQRFRVTGY